MCGLGDFSTLKYLFAIQSCTKEANDFSFFTLKIYDNAIKKQFSLKLKEYLLEQLEFVCNRDNCIECS